MKIRETRFVETLTQDLRYAARTMRRTPGFALIAVASSALGIGACSVIFTILNFALFTPLPVGEPRQLMSISEFNRRSGAAGGVLSYLDFVDLRQARTFDGIAATDPLVPASIGVQGDPQRHWGSLVSANYFDVVRPAFAAGRGFDAARDDTRGASRVVVLSHQLWQRQFGGDPAVVGRSIAVNGQPATVLGVTAAGFQGIDVGMSSEFWIPFSMVDEVEARSGPVTKNRRRYWLHAVGRLRPGADPKTARAELDVIAAGMNAAAGRADERTFHVERAGQIDPELRTMALTVFSVAAGVAALVLLTACSNVANLLLGRASARRREIAARMALGASRARILRQLLTESLLVAAAGGVAGWILAAYISSLLGLVRIPLGLPLAFSISPDYRVVLFSIALSVVTGVGFGLVPALRATRPDLVTDLKAEALDHGMRGRFRLRNALVVAQVAICTVLLLGTGLFLRSLSSARTIDLGLANRNLLLLSIDPGLDHRPDPDTRQLLGDLLQRARAVPGVQTATLTSAVPLTLIISNSNFIAEARARDPKAPRTRTDIYSVAPDFFDTMGITLLDGRDFVAGERATGVAIINDALARAAFPNESPIGRRIVGDGKNVEVVGVVSTAKSRTIGESPRPVIYLPVLDTFLATENRNGVTLVVKTRDAAAAYAAPLREAIRSTDPSLAIFNVRTMDDVVADGLLLPRLTWTLSASAGLVGLALAVIGVYGIIAFGVARRRRELGIRMAIGAQPGAIVAMVVREGAALALFGLALGLIAAVAVTRFLATLLYGVGPADPVTFVVVPLALFAVALTACLLPARSAARLNPVDVLRTE